MLRNPTSDGGAVLHVLTSSEFVRLLAHLECEQCSLKTAAAIVGGDGPTHILLIALLGLGVFRAPEGCIEPISLGDLGRELLALARKVGTPKAAANPGWDEALASRLRRG
jgi:hypothetical protein